MSLLTQYSEPHEHFGNWSVDPTLQGQGPWLCDSVTHSRPAPPTSRCLNWQRDPDREAVLGKGGYGCGLASYNFKSAAPTLRASSGVSSQKAGSLLVV